MDQIINLAIQRSQKYYLSSYRSDNIFLSTGSYIYSHLNFQTRALSLSCGHFMESPARLSAIFVFLFVLVGALVCTRLLNSSVSNHIYQYLPPLLPIFIFYFCFYFIFSNHEERTRQTMFVKTTLINVVRRENICSSGNNLFLTGLCRSFLFLRKNLVRTLSSQNITRVTKLE